MYLSSLLTMGGGIYNVGHYVAQIALNHGRGGGIYSEYHGTLIVQIKGHFFWHPPIPENVAIIKT